MIELHRDGHIATLRIARGQARNAITMDGWTKLAALACQVAASDARAVLLTSDTPGIFSAGADIAGFAPLQADAAARSAFREAMRAAIDAVAALPMPSIAAIEGGCYGAAVALVLACDLRVAGEGAQFATTPAKLGIGYPREDVARLSAQIGRGHAARMLFTGEIVDAGTAEAIGLVELRWEDAEGLARAFADRIAANAPDAVRLLKRTLANPSDPSLDAAFDDAFGSDSFTEGLAAFRERRRPVFE